MTTRVGSTTLADTMGWVVRVLMSLSCMSLVASCAAMVRTWEFRVDVAPAGRLVPTEPEARVTRDTATLRLRLVNPGPEPVAVSVERLSLELPDGTVIEGTAGLLAQGKGAAAALLDRFRDTPRQDPRTPPGDGVWIDVDFRDPRRDLRRYPWMRVDLSRVLVDGRPAMLPPLVLHAPPEAPLGQDI